MNLDRFSVFSPQTIFVRISPVTAKIKGPFFKKITCIFFFTLAFLIGKKAFRKMPRLFQKKSLPSPYLEELKKIVSDEVKDRSAQQAILQTLDQTSPKHLCPLLKQVTCVLAKYPPFYKASMVTYFFFYREEPLDLFFSWLQSIQDLTKPHFAIELLLPYLLKVKPEKIATIQKELLQATNNMQSPYKRWCFICFFFFKQMNDPLPNEPLRQRFLQTYFPLIGLIHQDTYLLKKILTIDISPSFYEEIFSFQKGLYKKISLRYFLLQNIEKLPLEDHLKLVKRFHAFLRSIQNLAEPYFQIRVLIPYLYAIEPSRLALVEKELLQFTKTVSSPYKKWCLICFFFFKQIKQPLKTFPSFQKELLTCLKLLQLANPNIKNDYCPTTLQQELVFKRVLKFDFSNPEMYKKILVFLEAIGKKDPQEISLQMNYFFLQDLWKFSVRKRTLICQNLQKIHLFSTNLPKKLPLCPHFKQIYQKAPLKEIYRAPPYKINLTCHAITFAGDISCWYKKMHLIKLFFLKNLHKHRGLKKLQTTLFSLIQNLSFHEHLDDLFERIYPIDLSQINQVCRKTEKITKTMKNGFVIADVLQTIHHLVKNHLEKTLLPPLLERVEQLTHLKDPLLKEHLTGYLFQDPLQNLQELHQKLSNWEKLLKQHLATPPFSL